MSVATAIKSPMTQQECREIRGGGNAGWIGAGAGAAAGGVAGWAAGGPVGALAGAASGSLVGGIGAAAVEKTKS